MRNRNYLFAWLVIGIITIFSTTSCSSASGGNTSDAEAKYSITFDSNFEGAAKTTLMSEKGAQVEQPTDPTRSGYDFVGWYTEQACINKFNFQSLVTQDLTLYAKWDDSCVLQSNSDPALFTAAGMAEKLFGPMSINGYSAGKKYMLNGYAILISVIDDTVENKRYIALTFNYPAPASFTYNNKNYAPTTTLGFYMHDEGLEFSNSSGELLIRRATGDDGSQSGIIIDGAYQNDYEMTKVIEQKGYGAALITAYGKSSITVKAYGNLPAGKYLATN